MCCMKRGLVALVVIVRREGSLLSCCFPWPSSLTFWAQCVFVFVCVCVGGGGGGGGAWPSIYFVFPNIFQEYKA